MTYPTELCTFWRALRRRFVGGRVKHQYVGDISDYRKYALLRALAAGGTNRIGVCWMFTPSDSSSDGNKLAYLRQPERYRHFDPQLFDILVEVAAEPDLRRLDTIEHSSAVPRATYFNDMLSDDLTERQAFMSRAASALSDSELVFFDPDNGMETTLPKGRKNSSKYVYLDELEAFYRAGKSILVYQHRPKLQRMDEMIRSQQSRLRGTMGDAGIWVFDKADVAFFLLVHPESPARLAIAAMEACSRWDSSFIRGEYVPRPQQGRNN